MLSAKKRLDGDRRSLIQVEPARGLRVPTGLACMVESADAAGGHGVALARRRKSGIVRSAGIGRSDSGARSIGDRGRVNPGILLIGSSVGPISVLITASQ